MFEYSFIKAIDTVAPLITVETNHVPKYNKPPILVKSKINKRKRLLELNKVCSCVHRLAKIKILNKEISSFFAEKKRSRVKSLAYGNKPNLWKAVKAAKDLSPDEIPRDLTLGGVPVEQSRVADAFAGHFNAKIQVNANKAIVKPDCVYNGKCKLIVQNRNFMTPNDVNECLNELKNKRCEGFDRIPVCALYDARDIVGPSLVSLFNSI